MKIKLEKIQDAQLKKQSTEDYKKTKKIMMVMRNDLKRIYVNYYLI